MIDEPSDVPGPLPTDSAYVADDAIEAGDAAAARGEWVLAISVWERLLETPDQAVAGRRIRWFLAETAGGGASRTRFSRGQFLAAAIVFAVVGSACVFLGQSQTGSSRNALSAIAWALYIGSAVLVVAYASVASESRQPAGEVTKTDLERARALAERLDSNHPGGDREI